MITFFVPGTPAPGGSKRAFINRRTGRAIVTDDCKRNKPWRERVAWTAREHYDGAPISEPLSVMWTFVMPRPKSHYRTGKHAGELRSDAPTYHTKKPDATKLVRAAEDALTGIIWTDDSVIACQTAIKIYGDTPGCEVSIVRVCDGAGG